jgi:hypothetical protein
MVNPQPDDGIRNEPSIKKEEPTFVHNIRQILGCLPVLGSIAVGMFGLLAFLIALYNLGDANRAALWLIGGCIGLIASGLGFGVLAWLVWANRRE